MTDLREVQARKQRAIHELNHAIRSLAVAEDELLAVRDFLHDSWDDELRGSKDKLVDLRDTLNRDLHGDRKELWEKKGRNRRGSR